MQKIFVFDQGLKDLNPLHLGQEQRRGGTCYVGLRNYTLIHYIRSGKGVLIKKGRKFTAAKGDCIITFPGEKYSLIADNEDPWSYIWIGFSGEKSEDFSHLPSVFHYEGDIFYRMLETKNISLLREYKLAALLFELYIELIPIQKLTPELAVHKARAYIESNYMHECKVSEIAKKLNYSRCHLSTTYKKIVGCPMKDDLIQIRMMHGYEYIKMGMTTAEVASLCGYPDAPSFSRAFKAHFGFTVKELQTNQRYMWDKSTHSFGQA